jgi:hypothetical protein
MKAYKVITRDVDGSDTRYYSSYKGAAKRFEDMSGYPLPKGHHSFETVSDYGCVVKFKANDDAIIPSYEAPIDDAEIEKYDEDGYRLDCIVTCDSPYGTYGSAEHQMYGDAWFYQDCPGAW